MIAQGVCCYFSCVSWDRKVPGAQQSFLFVLMQLYNQAKFHIDSRMIRYRPQPAWCQAGSQQNVSHSVSQNVSQNVSL